MPLRLSEKGWAVNTRFHTRPSALRHAYSSHLRRWRKAV